MAEQLPEELQRRPDAGYMQAIQAKKELEAHQASTGRMLGGLGLSVLLIGIVILFWRSRRTRKA